MTCRRASRHARLDPALRWTVEVYLDERGAFPSNLQIAGKYYDLAYLTMLGNPVYKEARDRPRRPPQSLQLIRGGL